MSILKPYIFIAFLLSISFSAQARSEGESMELLKEALMQSNGDYNKHKKKFNHDEFDRADEWAERDVEAIAINVRNPYQSEQEEFQVIRHDTLNNGNREVSSNALDEEENRQD